MTAARYYRLYRAGKYRGHVISCLIWRPPFASFLIGWGMTISVGLAAIVALLAFMAGLVAGALLYRNGYRRG